MPRLPAIVVASWLLASVVLAEPAPGKSDSGAGAGAADASKETALPPEHAPKLSSTVAPKTGVATGDVVHLTLRADALTGDDVTVPEQTFAPFEVVAKRARVDPAKDGRQSFVFEIELLAVEPGKGELKPIELRVVTKDGFVGSVRTDPLAVPVGSLLANEPNAQLKPVTKPVVVIQDDYTLLYVLGGVGGAALVALLTWLVSRYWQRRVKTLPPPPPPRPPWEIAIEKLGELRRRKQQMIEEGKAAQFVDEVSDVVRQYLGGHFGFDGLETTTDEMLGLLRERNANLGLLQEVAAYLARCDLVKFAKVVPDQDEADLVFSKAQDIVQFSMPLGGAHGRDPAGAHGSADLQAAAADATTPKPGNRGAAP